MQGEGLRRQNKYDEAIAKYREAIKLEPENYRYLFAVGKTYYQMKEYDNAVAAFNETIAKQPDFTPPYTLCAKIFLNKQEYDRAITYYEDAFKYEKSVEKKVQYKVIIVQLLMKQGKTDKAMTQIQDAKAVDPNNLDILYMEAKIQNEKGNYQVAKQSMITATEQLKDQPPGKIAKFYYELGVAYNKLGDYENAKKAWEKANFGPYAKLIKQELSLNSPGYFYTIAASYYMAAEYGESKKQIQKALELQSNYSKAYVLLGRIAKKEGNMREAASQYKTASDNEPDPSKKNKLLMGALIMQMDGADYSGAVSTVNSMGSASSPQITYYKGLAQYKLGQYSNAVSTLSELVNNPSLDAKTKSQYYFIMGMAYKNQSNSELAKSSFKNAMNGPSKAAAKNELDKMGGGKS